MVFGQTLDVQNNGRVSHFRASLGASSTRRRQAASCPFSSSVTGTFDGIIHLLLDARHGIRIVPIEEHIAGSLGRSNFAWGSRLLGPKWSRSHPRTNGCQQCTEEQCGPVARKRERGTDEGPVVNGMRSMRAKTRVPALRAQRFSGSKRLPSYMPLPSFTGLTGRLFRSDHFA